MKKKIIFIIPLVLLVLLIANVWAEDVTVCRELNESDTIYTLLNNVSSDGTCFVIGADNIIIDCDGYTIDYADTETGYGINNSGYNDTIIKNCVINQNESAQSDSYGIYFSGYSLNNLIDNNIITTSGTLAFGINFWTLPNNNNISNNNITTFGEYGVGINLYYAGNNNIMNNNITTLEGESNGINFESSDNNNIINNIIRPSTGDWARGIHLSSSYNNNIINNNIITNSVYGNGIDLISSEYCFLDNNTILINRNDANGIYAESSLYNNISNNNITTGDSASGVYLDTSSYYNLINNNYIAIDSSAIYAYGIDIRGSENNVTDNNITTSGDASLGIYLFASNNLIDNNLIITNGSSGSYGIYFNSSNNNNITNNNITTIGGSCGIYFYTLNSNNNISNNNVNVLSSVTSPSVYAIYFYDSNTNNTITNNNIIALVGEGGGGEDSFGIFLYSSNTNNLIINNDISSDKYGIYVYSSLNNITNNNITTSGKAGGDVGIVLDSISGDGWNNVIDNFISTVSTGILLQTSINNTLTLNNIITTGNDGVGIYTSSNNNNITNNNITTSGDEAYGLYLIGSSDNSITNNIVTTNGSYSYGITLYADSNNNTLTNNNITTSGFESYGIIFYTCSDNIINNNNITTSGDSSYGIYLVSSSNNNNLTSNNITTSGSDGYAFGIYCENSANNLIDNNFVETYAASGIRIQEAASIFNIIKNNTINTYSDNVVGISIIGSATNESILYNNITAYGSGGGAGDYGIYLDNTADYTNITNNNIIMLGSDSQGIMLYVNNYIDISNNFINISNNYSIGIDCDTLYYSNITNNNITTSGDNNWGIRLYGSGGGSGSDYNNLTNNNITTSGVDAYGVYFESSADYNSITNNNITTSGDGAYGIYFSGYSLNNLIDNNIITSFAPEIYVSNDNNNIFINNTIGNTYPTMLSWIAPASASFSISDIQIPLIDPMYYHNVSAYVNITNINDLNWLYLNISYNESKVINESKLKIGKYDTDWNTNQSTFSSEYGVNVDENYVYANLTSFSVFAPLEFTEEEVFVEFIMSDNLTSGINFGNRDPGEGYFEAIGQYNVTAGSANSVNIDFCVKANGDLTNGVNNISLNNYNFTMTNWSEYSVILTTEYQSASGGAVSLAPDEIAPVKALLISIPSSTPAGDYSNTIYIKAIEAGTSC